VRVSFRSPKRQSFDLEFWRFWINSREAIVDRSIIMDPSDDSNLIRREWAANVRERPSSMYLRAYFGQ
jgi:hypothetical protein